MHSRFFPVLALALLVLCSCKGQPVAPEINFIGIGTGTLATDIAQIQFSQTFRRTDKELVAVVSFAHVAQGTEVQATWFSPDERTIPLGRSTIMTESGAHVARFSFASRVPWEPSPYQLRIDAMQGEGNAKQAASGTLSFFIGMKESDIQNYREEYTAWQKREQEVIAAITAEEEAKKILTDAARGMLGTPVAQIVLEDDFTGQGKKEYVIVGQDTEESMLPGGATPGVLYAGSGPGFVIMNGSGETLLVAGERKSGKKIIRTHAVTLVNTIPKDADLQLAVLPSSLLSLTWTDGGGKICHLELQAHAEGGLTGKEPACR